MRQYFKSKSGRLCYKVNDTYILLMEGITFLSEEFTPIPEIHCVIINDIISDRCHLTKCRCESSALFIKAWKRKPEHINNPTGKLITLILFDDYMRMRQAHYVKGKAVACVEKSINYVNYEGYDF